MGYCEEGCEHLTRRRNCNKYHKRLTYFGYISRSLAYGSHERCSECDKDHYIKELEERERKLRVLIERHIEISDSLCPDVNSDGFEDGEDIFNKGRGQGMFQVCVQVKRILEGENNV